MKRARTFAAIALVLASVLYPVSLDAACPSPGTFYCEARCVGPFTYGHCEYSGDPCGLCKESYAGCAGWTSCACCDQFGPSF